jgi:hypothetical protein
MKNVGFWRTAALTLARNPISTFAVLCVASTAAFLGYMTLRMAKVLESPSWCGNAIQAEKISPGTSFVGLTSCVEMLKIQLQSMSTGFHISVGAFAFSLVVLIVIVVAGAKASGKLPGGVEFNVSKDAEKAAEEVAGAAVDKAEEIKGG